MVSYKPLVILFILLLVVNFYSIETKTIPEQGNNTISITIQNFQFSPSTIDVGASETVTFSVTNLDSARHTFTFVDTSYNIDITLSQDENSQVTFTAPSTPQTLNFFCSFHPSMTGLINITSSNLVTTTPTTTSSSSSVVSTTPSSSSSVVSSSTQSSSSVISSTSSTSITTETDTMTETSESQNATTPIINSNLEESNESTSDVVLNDSTDSSVPSFEWMTILTAFISFGIIFFRRR
ncbi:MAG: cupredoxin domain-containing protein, partial [Candidatus Hodarchaeales archaeon]